MPVDAPLSKPERALTFPWTWVRHEPRPVVGKKDYPIGDSDLSMCMGSDCPSAHTRSHTGPPSCVRAVV